MAPIYVAIMRGSQADGVVFSSVSGVDLDGNVEAFAACVKSARVSDLASVELWHMAVYGSWAAKPSKAEIKRALEDEDAPLAPNIVLSTLGDANGDRFFLVRITAPIAPPAAAGGAGVPIHGPAVDVATLLEALALRDALPTVYAHRWMDRQSKPVKLPSELVSFRRVVSVATSASVAARLYWFPVGAVELMRRREIVESSFAEFCDFVRTTADPDVWVWEPTLSSVSPTIPPAAAVAPEPATPPRGSASRSARSSHVQKMFRAAVMLRDGVVCTLCRQVPADEKAVEAAHVVRHGSSVAVLEEAALVSSNDTCNGVMLCSSPCHFWYDQLHWWVEPDGNVAASDALLHDADLGSHFSALVGRPLQQPQRTELQRLWPAPSTWAVQKRLCLEAADKRHEIAADALCYCVKCGVPYKTLRGLENHAASCRATNRRLLFTPAERIVQRDALSDGSDDDQDDDGSG